MGGVKGCSGQTVNSIIRYKRATHRAQDIGLVLLYLLTNSFLYDIIKRTLAGGRAA
jgi:hypothetical protein